MAMGDIEHCLFERFCPFIGVILTTIRADATVASKMNGFELSTTFALIYKVTPTFVLAGKHFVDFFDLNSAKDICCSEAKRVPVVIVLKYVLNSNDWFELGDCEIQ